MRDEQDCADVNLVSGGNQEYIPAGNYEGIFFKYDKAVAFGRQVLFLWFQISQGGYTGTELWIPFNFWKKSNRVPAGSKYYRAWCIANNGRPARGDRMSPRIFIGKRLVVSVVTVRTDAKQRELPDFLQYSRGDNVIQQLK